MTVTTGDGKKANPIPEASATRPKGLERRSGVERRHQPTPALSSFFGRGRRRTGRREGETDRTYVDTFTPREVALLLLIFILNIFDAFFTLLWLQRGGAEANPFMAFLLEIGEGAFLLQKCIVVGIWLIVLMIHKNFRLARIGLYSLAGVYSVLILGHFALIASAVDPVNPPEIEMPHSGETSDQRGQNRLYPERPNAQADSL
jgi:hypothetical protein